MFVWLIFFGTFVCFFLFAFVGFFFPAVDKSYRVSIFMIHFIDPPPPPKKKKKKEKKEKKKKRKTTVRNKVVLTRLKVNGRNIWHHDVWRFFVRRVGGMSNSNILICVKTIMGGVGSFELR